MDKYKISFMCKKQPKTATGLVGFEPDRIYTGRAYNGLYEISPAWGKGGPSKLIGKAVFDEYFEQVQTETRANQEIKKQLTEL